MKEVDKGSSGLNFFFFFGSWSGDQDAEREWIAKCAGYKVRRSRGRGRKGWKRQKGTPMLEELKVERKSRDGTGKEVDRKMMD